MGVEYAVYLIQFCCECLPTQVGAAVDQPLLAADVEEGAATQTLVAGRWAAADGAPATGGRYAGGVAAA